MGPLRRHARAGAHIRCTRHTCIRPLFVVNAYIWLSSFESFEHTGGGTVRFPATFRARPRPPRAGALGAQTSLWDLFVAVCVVSTTLADGSSPPPAPQLMYSARPWSQGPRRGRWEATGARFGAQIAPKHRRIRYWKWVIAVKIGFLDDCFSGFGMALSSRAGAF